MPTTASCSTCSQGTRCHVYNVVFHPDGTRLVSGDLKGEVREWDLATSEQLRTLDGGSLWKYDEGFRADIGGVRGIDFSPDARAAGLRRHLGSLERVRRHWQSAGGRVRLPDGREEAIAGHVEETSRHDLERALSSARAS